MKAVDISGQQFGRLTVIKRVNKKIFNRPGWLLRCDCGNEIISHVNPLRTGNTKSCGCLVIDNARMMGLKKRTHGQSNSTEWRAWNSMLERCQNKKAKAYYQYGGRGIKVTKAWSIFENFFKDMGKKSAKDLSLDRIDNNKGYSKRNCRWATSEEQSNNQRSNINYCFRGQYKTLSKWARDQGIPRNTVYTRVNRLGWSVDKALTVGAKN